MGQTSANLVYLLEEPSLRFIDIRKWKLSWNDKINLVKNGYCTKIYLKIQYNLTKILIVLFTEREISILNSHENTKDTEKRTESSKKNSAGWIIFPKFKTYYRTIATKTMWYWHKNRHVDQWDKTEDPNT